MTDEELDLLRNAVVMGDDPRMTAIEAFQKIMVELTRIRAENKEIIADRNEMLGILGDKAQDLGATIDVILKVVRRKMAQTLEGLLSNWVNAGGMRPAFNMRGHMKELIKTLYENKDKPEAWS